MDFKRKRLAILLSTAFILTGCGADKEAPPLLSEREGSAGRDAYFEALWDGDYAQVDGLIQTLQAEARTGDAYSKAVLGFTHAWKLAEYRRAPVSDPNVTDQAALAVDAFTEAMEDAPKDARLLGFRGSYLQAQGSITNNPLLKAKGLLDEIRAAQRWPAWGLFTKAYGLITLDPNDSLYRQGIDAMWQNLDVCAGEKVDRDNFQLHDYPGLFTPYEDPRLERACKNTDIVPHNLEGFFLYFGDMYAKAGELQFAESMYRDALSVNDGSWPYAYVVERRIERLNELPVLFNMKRGSTDQVSVEEISMFESQISCVACHQGEASLIKL